MRSPVVRPWFAVAALAACAPERAALEPAPVAPARAASAEIPAADALDSPWAIPPNARCSGRWRGEVRFPHDNGCDEATLAAARTIDIEVVPEAGGHAAIVHRPAGFAAERVRSDWTLGDPSTCTVDLVLRVPGDGAVTFDVNLNRGQSADARASLRLHRALPEPCWAFSEVAVEHVPDDSPLPGPDAAARPITGHYRLNVLWAREQLCPPPKLPPRFEIRPDPARGNALRVVGADLSASVIGEPDGDRVTLALTDDYHGEFGVPYLFGGPRSREYYELTIVGGEITGEATRRILDPWATAGGACSDRGRVRGSFTPAIWRW